MLSKKQKLISAGALTCLIILAAALNFTLARSGHKTQPGAAGAAATASPAPTTPDKAVPGELDFVTSYKDQRSQTRQQETQYLETILKDEKTDDTTRKAAQEQLMAIVANSESELAIEALLEAKGFTDVAVAIHNETVNVIVSAQSLSDEQVAQILEIAMREGKVSAENVKVIPAAAKNS